MVKRDSRRDSTGIVVGQVVKTEKLIAARLPRQRMTPAEARLWTALRGGQLDGWRFRRQQVIDGFIVDFYCHAAHLVVELDGEIHDGQREQDEARDQIIASRSLHSLRVPNDAVLSNLEVVLQQILMACAANPDGK